MPVDWNRLGLTGNPFENIAPGTRLEWVTLSREVSAALATRPFRVELVGDKGAGKSTTLRWYAATHPGTRYLYAPRDPLDGSLEGVEVLCLDEANAAAPAALQRLAVRVRDLSVLVSTHQALEAFGAVRSFALSAVPAFGWVARRSASASLAGAAAFDFAALVPRIVAQVGPTNYAVQRVLYELAENLARGLGVEPALRDAFTRPR